MATNYLPFAKRAVVTIAGNARASTTISDLSVGGCIRAHLGDLAIDWDMRSGTADFNINCRIGIIGQGYLTESFYTLNLYKDGQYPESGVWHFPKPYRLFPGQRMRAMTRVPNNAATPFDLANYPFFAAISFNGKRVVDDQPIMLYDRSMVAAVAGGSYVLNGETLQCPSDSPVDLYSVVFNPDYDRYHRGIERLRFTENMIWGPDDRQWWDQVGWTQMVNPSTTLMNLNRPEWLMKPTEGITVEFWYNNVPGGAEVIDVTLRGSLEVES